ncbi:MAG TPA: diguanylate cyclase [Gammaproteobacteria bacterium]|nr:diguanylate cyclase [Gammaproteobacteria bacterium]
MISRALLPAPVNRILVVCFALVALVPIAIVSVWLYQAAWKNAWREINEKHRLLAQNLASPITIYVNDHRHMLGLLAASLQKLPRKPDANGPVARELRQAFSHLKGFRSLALVDRDGNTLALAFNGQQRVIPGEGQRFSKERCFLNTRSTGQWSLSGIKHSPLDGQPTLIMSQAVHGPRGRVIGVLLGELRVDLIEKLRRKIRFGKRGHSAIVDATGHVIAHPNAKWMAQMKDISSWPIVQKMMAGKTGVTEFYSPFVDEEMVAGYASVPGIGWGVMVPQPKSEVARQVDALMYSNLFWSIAGLVLAIVLALLLSRWITRPINQLVAASEALVRNHFRGWLPEVADQAPREVHRLGQVLQRLVHGLQGARNEVDELNQSLQQRIEDATAKLREANARLEETARRDHLTRLANRRHFEASLGDLLSRRRGDSDMVCIMLIDIDNFKDVNDRYGHPAGDMVLNHLARILERGMRPDDLVARYGGDEFAAQLRCPRKIALQRAWDILTEVRSAALEWNDQPLEVTVSIGLLCHDIREGINVDALLQQVDMAMYEAKKRGRNTVVEFGLDN